jgi:hypothetical protein
MSAKPATANLKTFIGPVGFLLRARPAFRGIVFLRLVAIRFPGLYDEVKSSKNQINCGLRIGKL